MANSTRISYGTSLVVGGKLVADAVKNIIAAREAINRAVAIANSVTSNGASTANLEGSSEFNVGTGQGAAFYTALGWLKDGLNGMNLLAQDKIADVDPGG